MPLDLLDLFMQIDALFDKMQQQKSKGKSVLPFGALIAKLKGDKVK